MKLAEALVLRADIQRRVEQLRERLRVSALVQEGDQPPEDPQTLLAELNDLLGQLAGLIVAINRTNLQATLADGTTITAGLALRDVLDLRLGALKALADTASQRIDRYGRSEIRRVPTVDVGALRRDIDQIAQQRRRLDTDIQATNWTTELIS
jgi:hypothetical protein